MRYIMSMRTTLDIDEDILFAAKDISSHRGLSVGKVISDLVRESLKPKSTPKFRNGFPLLPDNPNAGIATLELVNRLRDESP